MAVAETKRLPYKVADLVAGRLGPQGNHAGRERNARPDGAAEEVRQDEAAGRGPHRRLSAHDHPNGGADRNAARTRRAGHLEQLQYFLHARSRRRGGGQSRHAGLRLERRDQRGIRLVHRAIAVLPRRPAAEHDSRRRRRSDRHGPSEISGAAGRHQGPERRNHHRRASAVPNARARRVESARPST